MKLHPLGFPVCLVALGACSSASAPTTTGPALSVVVSPLDLPLMSDACYALTVWNGADPDGEDAQEVWSQPSLCASRYGAEGGIRFTGICDAAAPDGKNAIRLVLTDVYTDGVAPDGETLTAGTDYINPCPPAPSGTEDNGCVLVADCVTNQDTRVQFDLTVMRQATLGFFDTVVKFEDVFCAAKLDCVDQEDAPLTYLYDVAKHEDGPTAVLGFACLGGSAADVFMYLDDVVVTCGTETSTIDPSAGPGNVTPTESNPGAPILFGAAVNTGAGFQGVTYWNVLIGMNPNASGQACTLTTRGTASESELTGSPFETPAHTRYPYIAWDVPLDDGTGPALTCGRQPLNGGNGVSTEYTAIDAPRTFARKLGGAADATCPCWGADADGAAIYDAVRTAASIEAAHQVFEGADFWLAIDGDSDGVYAGTYPDTIPGAVGPSGPFCLAMHWGSPAVTVGVQPITDAELSACLADLAPIVKDPCQTDNGGCGTEACVYDAPDVSHCVQCLATSDCGPGHYCTSEQTCAPGQCGSDADCAGAAIAHCDLASHLCQCGTDSTGVCATPAACTADGDNDGVHESGCDFGTYCNIEGAAPECLPGCLFDEDCDPASASSACIGGACTCEPESDEAFCARYFNSCSLTRADNCGVTRTVQCMPCITETAMAYSDVAGHTILFGGLSTLDGSVTDATWQWKGDHWVELAPATRPPARFLHRAVYDAARGEIVVFGGYDVDYSMFADTWVWNGVTWEERHPVHAPPAAREFAFGYDPQRARVVLFGTPGTWEWDGTDWTQMAATGPTGRVDPAFAYDAGSQALILFGGWGGVTEDETWSWNGSAWTELTPTVNPGPRLQHKMALDTDRGVIVLYGGGDGDSVSYTDTWEWSDGDWHPVVPATTDPGVQHHSAMTFDRAHHQLLVINSSSALTYGWTGLDWNILDQ